jgi:hypothetical protein
MMRLTEHLPDLLTPVRDLYVAAILETLADELGKGAEVDAEPVDRDGEGRVRRKGRLDLPSRHDLKVGRGGRALMRRVKCDQELDFRPVTAVMEDLAAVQIAPFRWCEVTVHARGARGKPNWLPLRRWYLEWFQARFGEESPDLLGVVHSLDGPHEEAGGWRFTVDMGSSSVACFSGLLEALAQSGCTEIRIGEIASAC